MLIGVVARPGTSPPGILDDVTGQIGVQPEATYRVHEHKVGLYRVPAYHLGLVDAGPRHVVVAIGVTRSLTRDIATAVAQALPSP